MAQAKLCFRNLLLKRDRTLFKPKNIDIHIIFWMPASVAELNAGPTGDQEVVGFTPTRPATFFRGDLS